jgi:molybdopterin-guanine dinucleotide biosynthesis protein A
LSLMAHLSGLAVESAPIPEGIPALILAGGQSRRFGSDKVLAEWRGRTLLDHVLDAATAGGRTAILSVSEGAAPRCGGLPRLMDPDPTIRTPLNGLLAGSRVLKGWFLVLASDAPGIRPEVLELLCEAGAQEVNRPVVITEDERLHPFPGLYHGSMIDAFEAAFDKGDYRVSDLVRSMNPITVPVERIRSVDPHLESLRNVNTPEELAALGQ